MRAKKGKIAIFTPNIRPNNMTTVIIENDSSQAKQLLEYIRTLPFVTVVGEAKKDFSRASQECNAVTVDEFIAELKSQVKSHFNHA